MNITARLKQARLVDRETYVRKEKEKAGNLRIGNSGIMNEEGEIAGGCHRVAHLRQLGLELDPPDASRLIMFEGGFANEERVLKDLQKTAFSPGEVLLCEEEIPVDWTTSNGTRVSGRPDIVSGNRTEAGVFIPIFGIELKTVNSVWVSRDALFSGRPKLENVIQAVHYMWKLNCPEWRLIYRSYSQQVVPAFGLRLPEPEQPMSEYVEYNEKGAPKFVKPYEVVYELKIDTDGRVLYRKERTANQAEQAWQLTIINTADITRFYEFVSRMEQDRTLGPELMLCEVDGKPKKYKHSAYCTACKLAEVVDGDYDRWRAVVQENAVKSTVPVIAGEGVLNDKG